MNKLLFGFLVVFAVSSVSGKHLWEEKLSVDFSNTQLLKEAFTDWMKHFEIEYSPMEEATRFLNFIDKWRSIIEFNNEKHPWDKKINQFSAMTSEEFSEVMLGCGWKPKDAPNATVIIEQKSVGRKEKKEYPSSVDWRNKGVVTPVKNQGQCGSCWAFSTVASTECNYAIATGQLNSLSEQELVDCDTQCSGCGGGWQAFNWVISNGGLCTESEYPYQGVNGNCKSSSCGTKYDPITGSVTVTPDSEQALLQATAIGCVSVYVDAAASAWQDYSSGVLTAYCPDSTDHVVCVVGYGSSNGNDYWLVKNSWGASWGMSGYINLCRGSSCQSQQSDGECGVLSGPGYPTV